jgi:hypothetical protein
VLQPPVAFGNSRKFTASLSSGSQVLPQAAFYNDGLLQTARGKDSMRRALAAGSLYLAILLVGCTPVASVRPLYTAEETKKPYRDQHLEGEWTMAVLDGAEEKAKSIPPCHVKIRPAFTGDVTYSAQFRCPVQEGEEETHVEVQLVPLGNNIFFDARPVYLSDKLKKVDLRDLSGIGVLPGHVLGQVWAQENFVRFALSRAAEN